MKSSKFLIILAAVILVLYLLFDRYPNNTERIDNNIPIKNASVNSSKSIVNQTRKLSIPESRKNAITMAVEGLTKSVVGINVTAVVQVMYDSPFARDPFWRHFFRPEIFEREIKELGSGFIISKDGYLVTNQHVVENAKEIIVTLITGEEFKAKIVGIDKQTDIALLKIEGREFRPVKLGDSNEIIIGEWAIALGNPFGLSKFNNQPSVTVGVISSYDMDFGELNDGRVYMDMLQTDASINPGNSGGPIANSKGEVIGMNSFIYTKSEGSIGLGFAIPINKVISIVDELKTYGKINRNWVTGISVETDQRLLNRYSDYRKLGYGILVVSVKRDSPGDKADIRAGDLILEINGIKVTSKYDVTQYIKENDLRPGDTITLKILRDGRTFTTNLTLGTA